MNKFPFVIPISFILLVGVLSAGALEIHVANHGDDRWEGTPTKPLRSLAGAKIKARAAAGNGGSGLSIVIHGGTYRLTESLSFTPLDSGSALSPTVWRAADGEPVVLSGGIPLQPTDFTLVSDGAVLARLPPEARGRAVYLDLAARGVKNGGPFADCFSEDDDGMLKLLVDGMEAPLSRWPKDGNARMAEVTAMGLEKGSFGRFRYTDPAPESWDLEAGIWLTGWWRVEFARHTVKLGKVDASLKEITLAGAVPNGIGSKFHRPNKQTGKIGSGKEPWFAINVLEELRRPGEWCVDFRTKRLYFLPPARFAAAAMELCDLKAPLLRLSGASNLAFIGLRVVASLEDGFALSNAAFVRIAGCELSQVRCGVKAYEPFRVETLSCDVHDVREIGIDYEYQENRKDAASFRGERSKNLVSGGDRIANNHVWNAAIGLAMGSKGFPVDGRIENNLVHDIRGMGLRYGGNGLIIEKNEFHNLLLQAGDGGAIYSCRRVTDRGNLVRWNLIHHAPGVNAIYIDDGECGTTATGNVVVGAEVGGFISGGRENGLVSNLFIACRTAALHADDRGVSRGYGDPKTPDGNYMWNLCYASVDLAGGPWAERYPGLLEALAEKRGYPYRNFTGENLIVDSPTEFRRKYQEANFIECQWGENCLDFTPADFIDLARLDLRPAPGSRLGAHPVYRAIPLGEIGLVADAYRKSLPPADTGRFVAKRRFGDDDVSLKDMEASNKK
ncbi:MAG: right-handed parallel beta-helix repeat-containing protein [Spirochaetes bacterium]|nr:right-handed parallel beta-helix repeat-containing protein [Spirochaetota bacterium]